MPSLKSSFKHKLKGLDLKIFIPVILMIAFGIIMVYSSSSYIASNLLNNSQYYFIRQLINSILGLILLFATYLLPIKHFKNGKYIQLAVVVLFVSLTVVLLFSDPINGAKGWIDLGFFSIQPAEFAKIIVIIYFAYFLSNKQKLLEIEENPIKPFSKSFIMILLILGLIVVQPDMGTALIIASIVFIMYLSSGIAIKYSLIFAGSAIALAGLVFFTVYQLGPNTPFLDGYQYERFLAFWDPFAVSDSSGLQLINSYYALARGGIDGVGIGNSVQKTGYLPEPYTDFIISIIGEELGWVGVVGLLLVFTYLILRIFRIALKAKDPFNSLLTLGIGAMLFIQGSINIGGAVGLLPITGVTFPFISYGGSSMLVLCISIGLVLNVSYTERQTKERKLKNAKKARINRRPL